jgi:hypothetical protein
VLAPFLAQHLKLVFDSIKLHLLAS